MRSSAAIASGWFGSGARTTSTPCASATAAAVSRTSTAMGPRVRRSGVASTINATGGTPSPHNESTAWRVNALREPSTAMRGCPGMDVFPLFACVE